MDVFDASETRPGEEDFVVLKHVVDAHDRKNFLSWEEIKVDDSGDGVQGTFQIASWGGKDRALGERSPVSRDARLVDGSYAEVSNFPNALPTPTMWSFLQIRFLLLKFQRLRRVLGGGEGPHVVVIYKTDSAEQTLQSRPVAGVGQLWDSVRYAHC